MHNDQVAAIHRLSSLAQENRPPVKNTHMPPWVEGDYHYQGKKELCNDTPGYQIWTPTQQQLMSIALNGPPRLPSVPLDEYNGPPNQQNGPPNQYKCSPNQNNGPPNQKNSPPNQNNGPPNQKNGAPNVSNRQPQDNDSLKVYNLPQNLYSGPQNLNKQLPLCRDSQPVSVNVTSLQHVRHTLHGTRDTQNQFTDKSDRIRPNVTRPYSHYTPQTVTSLSNPGVQTKVNVPPGVGGCKPSNLCLPPSVRRQPFPAGDCITIPESPCPVQPLLPKWPANITSQDTEQGRYDGEINKEPKHRTVDRYRHDTTSSRPSGAYDNSTVITSRSLTSSNCTATSVQCAGLASSNMSSTDEDVGVIGVGDEGSDWDGDDFPPTVPLTKHSKRVEKRKRLESVGSDWEDSNFPHTTRLPDSACISKRGKKLRSKEQIQTPTSKMEVLCERQEKVVDIQSHTPQSNVQSQTVERKGTVKTKTETPRKRNLFTYLEEQSRKHPSNSWKYKKRHVTSSWRLQVPEFDS